MARIRSLHPTQATDEAFVQCSAFARLLALHIRCEADDNGIFEWKPIQIKMRIFPADSLDVVPLLQELLETEQIARYQSGSSSYGIIRNFRKWQSPRHPAYTFPAPKAVEVPDKFLLSLPDAGNDADSGHQETAKNGNDTLPTEIITAESGNDVPLSAAIHAGEERRGVGEEKEEPSGSSKKSPRGSRLPESWIPNEELKRWSLDQPKASIRLYDRELEKFCDHWPAQPGVKGLKLDWDKTWRNWFRGALDRLPNTTSSVSRDPFMAFSR